MNNHEEYGQGFVDGFNAALKSDYIKEKFQAQDKESYIKRIRELEEQLDKIRTAIYNTYNAYQMCNTQQAISLFDLTGTINAYRRY